MIIYTLDYYLLSTIVHRAASAKQVFGVRHSYSNLWIKVSHSKIYFYVLEIKVEQFINFLLYT
jgi:hypothetical protein